jgi:hypothetical protein
MALSSGLRNLALPGESGIKKKAIGASRTVGRPSTRKRSLQLGSE